MGLHPLNLCLFRDSATRTSTTGPYNHPWGRSPYPAQRPKSTSKSYVFYTQLISRLRKASVKADHDDPFMGRRPECTPSSGKPNAGSSEPIGAHTLSIANSNWLLCSNYVNRESNSSCQPTSRIVTNSQVLAATTATSAVARELRASMTARGSMRRRQRVLKLNVT